MVGGLLGFLSILPILCARTSVGDMPRSTFNRADGVNQRRFSMLRGGRSCARGDVVRRDFVAICSLQAGLGVG